MDDWHYEPATDLDLSLAERLRHFPREPDMLSYGVRSLCAAATRTWLRGYHRLKITGAENLPVGESFVMVANHGSHLDALCLLASIPLARLHRAFPAAAADYFFINLPRLALSVLVINALPFDRKSHCRDSLELCRQLLRQSGNVLILFPEGTRSANGAIGAFKPGVGIVLAESNVPAVPCRLIGTHEALPKGAWLPRPTAIELRIGCPLRFPSERQDKPSVNRICRKLREAVLALSPVSDASNALPTIKK